MKKIFLVVALFSALFGAFTYKEGSRVAFAQAAGTPLSMQVAGSHTACAVTASTTTFCFASDGLYQSLNGAAYVQLGAATTGGVASITVCNAVGSGCGSAQTGSVSLNIPTKAATTVTPTVNVTAPVLSIFGGDLAVAAPTVTVTTPAVTTLQ